MVQKYALVAGCNYPNTDDELMGCINDSISMYHVLINRFGFDNSNVVWLTDGPGNQYKPTVYNIKAYLNGFFSKARPRDVVFLFFAGHGTIVPAHKASSGKDEQAIFTSDSQFITSIDFRQILNGAPNGVSFVIMSDSCNSGGLIDKEQEQIGPGHPPRNRGLPAVVRPRWISFEAAMRLNSLQHHVQNHDHHVREHFNPMFGSEASLIFQICPPMPWLQPDLGILLSGCQPNESSGETTFDGIPHGVFTSAVLHILRTHHGHITNRDLVLQARKFLQQQNVENQHPCLYCSDWNAQATFLS